MHLFLMYMLCIKYMHTIYIKNIIFNVYGMHIFLIGRAKRAPHWGVQSRFRVIYVCMYVYMYICRYVSYVKLTA